LIPSNLLVKDVDIMTIDSPSEFLRMKKVPPLFLTRYPYMQDKSFVKKVNPLYSFSTYETEEGKATYERRRRNP
jgi:hypothetical protein